MIVIQLMINVNLSWIFFTFNQYLPLSRNVILSAVAFTSAVYHMY